MSTRRDTLNRIGAGLGVCVLGAALAHAQSGARTGGATSPRAQPASHQQMVALLESIAVQSKDTHPFLADKPARDGRAKLAALPSATPDADRWLVHMDLGEAELRLGNLPQAIDHFSRARDLVSRAGNPASLGPWLGSNLFRLGAAYLRLGESQNCALHAGATNCILPLRGESLHRMQEPSKQAIATFAQALLTDPNTSLSLSTRWLLNIAHMTLGTYPQQVPDALLGAAAKIDRLEIWWPLTGETQTFTDVAADQIIRVVEGEASFTRLPLRRSVLGGGAGRK